MTVHLYMDHHVQSAITHGLRLRSVDVLTAFEDGTADWQDEQLELIAKASEPDDLRNRIEFIPFH